MPKGPLLPPLCPQPFNFIFPFAVYFASSTFSLFPLFLSFLCFGSSVPLVHHVASRVSYHMMMSGVMLNTAVCARQLQAHAVSVGGC